MAGKSPDETTFLLISPKIQLSTLSCRDPLESEVSEGSGLTEDERVVRTDSLLHKCSMARVTTSVGWLLVKLEEFSSGFIKKSCTGIPIKTQMSRSFQLNYFLKLVIESSQVTDDVM